ncbi:MAG: cation:proton antiporter, partial [Fibrobacterota bacterium]
GVPLKNRFFSVEKTRPPETITFGTVTAVAGICRIFSLSFILCNMALGFTIGNDRQNRKIKQIEEKDLGIILQLLFVLFFTVAGANLHIKSLPDLGFIGLAYIAARSIGKFAGAYAGASQGGMETSVKNNLGFGLLSQAGVAIGLTLLLKHKLSGLGPVMEGKEITMGDYIGSTVFTTITAASVVFETAGPLAAKFGLKRAGEIKT